MWPFLRLGTSHGPKDGGAAAMVKGGIHRTPASVRGEGRALLCLEDADLETAEGDGGPGVVQGNLDGGSGRGGAVLLGLSERGPGPGEVEGGKGEGAAVGYHDDLAGRTEGVAPRAAVREDPH